MMHGTANPKLYAVLQSDLGQNTGCSDWNFLLYRVPPGSMAPHKGHDYFPVYPLKLLSFTMLHPVWAINMLLCES